MLYALVTLTLSQWPWSHVAQSCYSVIQGFVFQNKIRWLSLTFPVNHTTFPWPILGISAQISVLKLHHKNTISWRQAIPMKQGTLYSLDRSLPNVCDCLRRRPLLKCQFWLNLVGWGIPCKYVKYNLSDFLKRPFFRVHA